MPIQLQNVKQTAEESYPWGRLRWLMSDELQPGAEQTMGVVQIDPGQHNPLHLHPNCEELLYVTAGACEHLLGDEKVLMKVGDLIRIPRNVPHYAKCVSNEPLEAIIVFSAGDRQATALEK